MVVKNKSYQEPNQVDLESLILEKTTPSYVTGPLVELRAKTKKDTCRISNLLHTLCAQANYRKDDTLEKIEKTVKALERFVVAIKK